MWQERAETRLKVALGGAPTSRTWPHPQGSDPLQQRSGDPPQPARGRTLLPRGETGPQKGLLPPTSQDGAGIGAVISEIHAPPPSVPRDARSPRTRRTLPRDTAARPCGLQTHCGSFSRFPRQRPPFVCVLAHRWLRQTPGHVTVC